MKKILIIVILLLGNIILCSCGFNNNKIDTRPLLENEPYRLLSKSKRSIASEVSKTNESLDLTDLWNLNNLLSSRLIDDNDNRVCSPLSFYMGLAILSQGTSNVDQIDEFNRLISDNKIYDQNIKLIIDSNYDTKWGTDIVSNSLWYRGDFSINSSFIEKINKKYYVDSYLVDFNSDSGKNAIIEWINDSTKNFMNLDSNNYLIEDNLDCLLLNTIYFDNKWLNQFIPVNNRIFYDGKGNEYLTPFMGNETNALYCKIVKEGLTYEAICHELMYGNKMYFIMCDSGKTTDCLNIKLDEIMAKFEIKRVQTLLPKFAYEDQIDYKKVLLASGYHYIFEKPYDLITNDSLFINSMSQKIKIDVNYDGVKAAGVFQMSMGGTPSTEDVVYVTLDHPFLFYITDINEVILFVGSLNKPTFEAESNINPFN